MSNKELTQEAYESQLRAIEVSKKSWVYRRFTVFLLLSFFIGIILTVLTVGDQSNKLHEMGLDLSFSGITILMLYYVFGDVVKDVGDLVRSSKTK